MSVSMDSLARIFILRLGPALAFVCALVLLASPGSASAQDSGYSVTYVARSCPSYTDIFANRARNDIQESLKDLGPDTQYSGDFLVSPAAESMPPQDKCTSIPNWKFTLGTGYQSHAVDGPWGSLSKVTNPYDTSITTKVSTPLLDKNGLQVDNETLAGAVTVELTPDQAKQASSANSLWLQGGTPTDPVLAGVPAFAGPKYGFGALRCATDALNGDNVEFIFFPSGVKHVFCYGLYVTPPPDAGEITIEKRVTGAPAHEDPSFVFNGSISFDPHGFQLRNGESMDFARAGGATWNVTETPVDNYLLTSVDCSATTTGTGPPASTWTAGPTTTIKLVAGEHVTCVFNNHYVPPGSGLTIRKITLGGTGTFGYTVSGAGGSHEASATTTAPRVPVDAHPSPMSLVPGPYTIRERGPTSPDGTWRLVRVICNGQVVSTRPVHVEVTAGQGSVCTFVNGLHPPRLDLTCQGHVRRYRDGDVPDQRVRSRTDAIHPARDDHPPGSRRERAARDFS